MSGPIRIGSEAQLRRLTPDDAPALCTLVARNRARLDSLGMRDWGEALYDLEATRATIQTFERFYSETRGLVAGIWAKGALVGLAGHNRLDVANKRTDVGYWLDAGHEGQGLATRACRALVSYAFAELHLVQVTIRCEPSNEHSQAVAERLGFTRRESELDFRQISSGVQVVEWLIYTMQASAWPQQGALA